jgi:hypothetical protein
VPTITAFPDQADAIVRVEINWADTPGVRYAGVNRYNTVTGECVPLRPYICYDGDNILLSCGHGIFFDTEMPLDTPFYYITEGVDAPCIPEPAVADIFQRVLVNSWGNADTGQAWALTGGAVPADYDVNGSRGTHTVNTVNVFRNSTVDSTHLDFDLTVNVEIPALPIGAPITVGLLGRFTNVNNNYMGRISIATTGVVTIQITKLVAGVGTLVASAVSPSLHAAGNNWNLRFQGIGSSLKVKAWNQTIGELEPANFQVTATDTDLTTGTSVGVTSRLDAGNGNGSVLFAFDDFYDYLPCKPCVPVSVDTSDDPTTILSGGIFRLRDPVRPCNDQAVPLCFTQANAAMDADGYCIPGNGIFFASMDTEDYEPNTLTLNSTNAKYPLAMSRTRRGVSSLLTLVTRTFADRDALLTLAEPGSPLFWHGPAAYGIPDQYMDVGRLSIQRGLSDHKFQVRVASLPYTSVARPAGPSQGVCGSQVQDYCDFTWDELAAAGYTFDDLIRGTPNGSTPGYRTWTIGANTVLGDFADWNAVDDGTRTWTDLEVGL